MVPVGSAVLGEQSSGEPGGVSRRVMSSPRRLTPLGSPNIRRLAHGVHPSTPFVPHEEFNMPETDKILTPPQIPVEAGAQGSVTVLISGILDDVQRLGKQQIDMLKAEFQEDLRRTKRATEMGGLGVVALTIGGLALVACLVFVLHEQFHITMWASCLIIGGVLAGSGIALGLYARNLFESFNPLPDKTFTALQENLTWKTQPQA